jgi:LCP family protein required for cell wall assembly
MTTSGSSARAFAGRLVIALVVGSLLMTAAVAGVDREVGRKLDRIPKIELLTAPLRPGGANYLLVGSDTRDFVSNELEAEAFGTAETEAGRRSDTIMVVHVEPEAERTFIVSFPRDLWVNIPGHGNAKINAAYNYDQQTLIDTLKQNFDIDVNHYIELNFKSFVELVDSLGKVPVYVPYPARDEYTALDLPNAGCVELDGELALQYVRSRYLEYQNPETGRWVPADIIPDLGRIGRQQEFMRRLTGLAVQKSLANPFTANLVADRIVTGLKADDAFDKSSVFALLDAFRTLNPDDTSSLQMVTLPTRGGPNQGGQSVLYANTAEPLFDQIVNRLRTFDNTPRPAPTPSDITVRVVNASSRADLAVAVAQELRALGFASVEAVEGSAERITGIDVRVAPEESSKGKLLLRYIEPTAQLTTVPASDVDVTIVLGRDFRGIIVPAGAAAVPTTAASTDPAAAPVEPVPSPEPVEDVPVLDAPTTTSTLPAGLPEAAPRLGC